MIVRLAAGGGALLALGACGSGTPIGDAAGQPDRAFTSTTVSTVSSSSPSVTSVTSVTSSVTSVASTSSDLERGTASGRRTSADVQVDGASISVTDDGSGALTITALDTEPGWNARVDDTDPAALRVELSAPGRRTVVEIHLTGDGIVTSTDSQATAP